VESKSAALTAVLAVLCGCTRTAPPSSSPAAAETAGSGFSRTYLDYSTRDDVLSGGVKMIPITTPKGTFHVWTKRVGNNPAVKVLLLHGGPAAGHEYLEAFDSYFPKAGIEYYYYDQLGSFFSDQPNEPSLWEVPRFVDEVEQVRQALGLTKDNFYLLGHSWGGILAMEYALAHPGNVKALVISNMMSSIPAYNEYARKVLMPAMDQRVLAEVKQLEAAKKYDDPRYMELLIPGFYTQHLLRMPADQWPEPVQRSFKHVNEAIYVPMQGPSELGASGKLEHWDRSKDLPAIAMPTLVIGARYDTARHCRNRICRAVSKRHCHVGDTNALEKQPQRVSVTMDPSHMEMMSKQVQHGRYLFCPNGSHLAMYDDQKTYFDGVVKFIEDVDAGRFP
jgi:proline iminopeptidase